MFCTKCGTKNEKENKVCKKCGHELSHHKKKTVTVPDSITIDTSFVKKLTKFQQMYIVGGILVAISSFLPWIKLKSPNLAGVVEMVGGKLPFSSTTLNIWNFGSFGGLFILFYFLPLIVLGYVAYQEVMQKKPVSIFIKSLTVALICLLTFSLNLYLSMAVWQLQSMLGTIMKLSGTEGVVGNVFGMGIGLLGSVIGCGLVVFGLLSEIKAKEK